MFGFSVFLPLLPQVRYLCQMVTAAKLSAPFTAMCLAAVLALCLLPLLACAQQPTKAKPQNKAAKTYRKQAKENPKPKTREDKARSKANKRQAKSTDPSNAGIDYKKRAHAKSDLSLVSSVHGGKSPSGRWEAKKQRRIKRFAKKELSKKKFKHRPLKLRNNLAKQRRYPVPKKKYDRKEADIWQHENAAKQPQQQ